MSKQKNPGKVEILKKYTGQGGIVKDTIKEIPNTIGNAYSNVKDKVQSGITNGIVNVLGDTPAGNTVRDGLANQKKGILKNTVNRIKSMPESSKKPTTPPGLERAPGILKKNPSLPTPPTGIKAKPAQGSFMKPGYKPGSIKRGYTRYA